MSSARKEAASSAKPEMPQDSPIIFMDSGAKVPPIRLSFSVDILATRGKKIGK